MQSLQWTVSGYLLTYGGFLLLGGRAANLVGRPAAAGCRDIAVRDLLAGRRAGGQRDDADRRTARPRHWGRDDDPRGPFDPHHIVPRGKDRIKAIGAWSGTIPLASVLGVLLGGLLSQGPGWRWVFFVNVPVCAVVLTGAFRLLDGQQRRTQRTGFDAAGAVLSTAGVLILVYALVNAPSIGWGAARTIAGLAAAAALLTGFAVNEQRRRNPLVPFSIFTIKGLAAADATQVIAQAGFYAMFFFVTLYMQTVLHFSPIAAGAAYIPVTIGVGIASVVSTKMLPRTGTRPIMVAGTLLGAAGVYWLSRIPVHGSYLSDILPGLVVMALGLGAVFVGVQTAANAGVPADQAGLAAALITTSSTLGGALGLAIFSAIATGRTQHLLAAHASRAAALTSGFQHALIACSVFLVVAAAIAARATSTRGAASPVAGPEPAAVFEPEPAAVPDAA